MILYDFMDKEFDRSGYEEKFREYNIMEMNLQCVSDICKFLIDDLCKYMKERDVVFKHKVVDNEHDELLQRVKQFLSDPANYLEDIFAACYMSILYNEPDNHVYVERLDPGTRRVMHSAINYKGKIIDENPMFSLKGPIYEKYPVPLYYNGQTGRLVMLPGGCVEYHKAVLDIKFFKIYDLSEDNTTADDYTRYSFTKTYPIWNKIARSSIENLLMMEFSLSCGCSCYMFEKLSWIKEDTSLFAWERFVKTEREFPHFFMRKQLLRMMFDWFEKKDYQNVDVVALNRLTDFACELLSDFVDIINDRLIRSLKLFSILMWGDGKESVKSIKMEEDEKELFQKPLIRAWNTYYDNKSAYWKCIEPLIGEGWYGIDDYRECFQQIYLTQETLERLGLAHMHTIELEVPSHSSERNSDGIIGLDYNCKYTIRCKEPYNAVGWKLWEHASRDLLNNPTPNSAEECASLLEQKISQKFEEMKKCNEETLAAKQVKVTLSAKKVGALYLYGYLQKYLVSSYPKITQ